MDTKNTFDEAAQEADRDLGKILAENGNPDFPVITQWYLRWYGKAGHKRMGRIIATRGAALAQEEPA